MKAEQHVEMVPYAIYPNGVAMVVLDHTGRVHREFIAP
jgi:hypothetical protein